jgi:hypothetical protein
VLWLFGFMFISLPRCRALLFFSLDGHDILVRCWLPLSLWPSEYFQVVFVSRLPPSRFYFCFCRCKCVCLSFVRSFFSMWFHYLQIYSSWWSWFNLSSLVSFSLFISFSLFLPSFLRSVSSISFLLCGEFCLCYGFVYVTSHYKMYSLHVERFPLLYRRQNLKKSV